MNTFHDILRAAHIGFGAVGLLIFWVPVFAKKGGRVHRGAGTVFKFCVYVVTVSAIVSGAWALLHPLSWARVPGSVTPEEAANTARDVRGIGLFLGSLGLTTLLAVRSGILALRLRRDPRALAAPSLVVLGAACLVAGIGTIANGFVTRQYLFSAVGLIPLLAGGSALALIRNPPSERMAWWYEHMGNMLGAGIAFYTAFLVFGSGRLLGVTLEPPLAFIPWLGPTLIGIPAISLWTRAYKRKFTRAPGVESTSPDGR